MFNIFLSSEKRENGAEQVTICCEVIVHRRLPLGVCQPAEIRVHTTVPGSFLLFVPPPNYNNTVAGFSATATNYKVHLCYIHRAYNSKTLTILLADDKSLITSISAPSAVFCHSSPADTTRLWNSTCYLSR